MSKWYRLLTFSVPVRYGTGIYLFLPVPNRTGYIRYRYWYKSITGTTKTKEPKTGGYGEPHPQGDGPPRHHHDGEPGPGPPEQRGGEEGRRARDGHGDGPHTLQSNKQQSKT
ncbi:hypothetical protein HanRHA438_Chr16g0763231 [Helianthus annuus]|nr:hypothetical protein HanRHA438_Chr16g0763231 [Helianthus annuus]